MSISAPSPTDSLLNGVARLDHLGVIRVQGEDAAKFLHGQLTQDFALLGHGEARLTALCSPKGRMLASFIGFKTGADQVLLVCSRDLLAQTLKRLSMFVLRAKAKLTDATPDFALYGLAGAATQAPEGFSAATWAKTEWAGGTLVQLYPADGVPRQLWVAPADAAAPDGADLSPQQWQWSEVRSGVATLSLPVVEAFVPQMLNYESIGGVNFKKGCYPGQEVVARSQFRGTLKRRAWLVHGEAAPIVGSELFLAHEPEQPAATVVQAAPTPHGGWDAIVSGQIAALESGPLHLGAADGPALTALPLPYALLDDI